MIQIKFLEKNVSYIIVYNYIKLYKIIYNYIKK